MVFIHTIFNCQKIFFSNRHLLKKNFYLSLYDFTPLKSFDMLQLQLNFTYKLQDESNLSSNFVKTIYQTQKKYFFKLSIFSYFQNANFNFVCFKIIQFYLKFTLKILFQITQYLRHLNKSDNYKIKTETLNFTQTL